MKKTFTTKDLTTIAIFTGMTAVLAQITIPLPFTPVPFSLGLVAVYITAILLKPKQAVFAQVCYLLLGALGIPVFGNFSGGVSTLLGPTGGYLMVYPIMAWLVSFALNRQGSHSPEKKQNKGRLFLRAGLAMGIAHFLLYSGGTVWLSFTTGNSLTAALALAVYPFIVPDLCKIIFCVFVIVPLRTRMLPQKHCPSIFQFND